MDLTAVQSVGSSQASQAYATGVSQAASGERLTRSSDGAAELAVANGLRGDLMEVEQAVGNLIDGISMLQTADGAIGAVSDNLIRMKALAMQAQNETLSDQQREIIGAELSELAAMNTQIGAMTEFNGVKLFAAGELSIAAGDALFAIDTQAMPAVEGDVTVDAAAVLASIENAAAGLNIQRGRIGADMTRMEHYVNNLDVQANSLLTAESAIRNMDAAQIAASYTARQIVALQAYASNAHNRVITETAHSFFGGMQR